VVARSLALALAAASLIGVSLPWAAGASQPPRASLRNLVCQPASNQLNRVIEVTAAMRPLPGTQHMEIRFVLLRELSGQSQFSSVRGTGLGNWLAPQNPTLGQIPTDVWKVNKPVVNLRAPAVYRFRVTFRWIGRSGVIRSRTRLSPLCTQPQ
jgi:hypothetical protein